MSWKKMVLLKLIIFKYFPDIQSNLQSLTTMSTTTFNKTRLCQFAEKCKFGAKCKFAHSQAELYKPACWFFNNGGCKNESCKFAHIIVQGLRKPIQIQKPCRYQNTCNNEQCQFDHFELTETEWKYHFIGIKYPGAGYYNQQKQVEKIKVKISFAIYESNEIEIGSKLDQSSFPILGKRNGSTNTVNSVWQKQKQAIQKEAEKKQILPPILKVILENNDEYKYNIKAGVTWADEVEM